VTDEEKQAVEELLNKKLRKLADVAAFDISEGFWDEVEADLSSKKMGFTAICETWDKPGSAITLALRINVPYGHHYRVIPTAQDALDVLRTELDNDEAVYSHHEHYLAGKKAACVAVLRLIDNAQEG